MTSPDTAPATAVTDSSQADSASRIRFVEARTRKSPTGLCHADVELERVDGERVVGSRSGQPSAMGAIRVAAEATVEALHRAVTAEQRFELVGVKTVRAFDQTVVLVLLTTRTSRGLVRLVGAAVGDSADDADVSRAAVLAVLNASNRVLSRSPL
jgi:hypothetical protein